jgi:hypothetical protein
MEISVKPLERKYYLDNIRWLVIVLVFIHHIVYMFNSEGLRGHFWAEGIPVMDMFSHVVYPWFMGVLFLVSGIAAKYSLKCRTITEFRKDRFAKLMRPFVFGMLILSPVVAYHMFQTQGTLSEVYAGMGNVPMAAKYSELWIMCFLIGMAQLWFIAELYIFSRLLLWIKKKDRNGKLDALGQKCGSLGKSGVIGLVVMGILYVLLAKSLDLFCSINYRFMGLWLVLRPQLYFYMFLLGYYVFARDEILEKLKKAALPLALTAIVFCVAQSIYSYSGDSIGANGRYDYTISSNFILPAIYAYIAMLAILGCAGRWFNHHNKFTTYMADRSFGFYMFHYIVLVYAADVTVNYLHIHGILRYAVTFLIGSVGTLILTEIIRLIPGIRTLFGIKGLQRN